VVNQEEGRKAETLEETLDVASFMALYGGRSTDGRDR